MLRINFYWFCISCTLQLASFCFIQLTGLRIPYPILAFIFGSVVGSFLPKIHHFFDLVLKFRFFVAWSIFLDLLSLLWSLNLWMYEDDCMSFSLSLSFVRFLLYTSNVRISSWALFLTPHLGTSPWIYEQVALLPHLPKLFDHLPQIQTILSPWAMRLTHHFSFSEEPDLQSTDWCFLIKLFRLLSFSKSLLCCILKIETWIYHCFIAVCIFRWKEAQTYFVPWVEVASAFFTLLPWSICCCSVSLGTPWLNSLGSFLIIFPQNLFWDIRLALSFLF